MDCSKLFSSCTLPTGIPPTWPPNQLWLALHIPVFCTHRFNQPWVKTCQYRGTAILQTWKSLKICSQLARLVKRMGMVRPRSGFSHSLSGPVNWAGLWSQTVLLTLTSCSSHVCQGSQGGSESLEGYLNSAFPPRTLQAGPGQGGLGILSCG